MQPIEKGKVPENQDGAAFREARLARLRRRIRPLLLRRTKELVARDLPPKQEQELRVELSPAHRAAYDMALQRERQKVLGLLDDLDRNRFIVFRSLTLLRMLAPRTRDSSTTIMRRSSPASWTRSWSTWTKWSRRGTACSCSASSPRSSISWRNDWTLTASPTCDSTGARDAAARWSHRSAEGDAPVFLISLKAGGFGLTLTEADYVFLLDPWWNPAAESQAVDRAHRIGQQRSVMVYRLIAAGTIEEKVLALQRRKARLFAAVMDDEAVFASARSRQTTSGACSRAERPRAAGPPVLVGALA